ncbi:DDE_3 domain-containing protein [Trichonephila clavipes]|nr:DDE_3 domain-containing protein [Trichonephila clavipes]
MIWTAVSWFSAGPIITHTGKRYREILTDQVHLLMQTVFPAGDGILRDDNAPAHAVEFVQGFDEHEDVVKHLPWPTFLKTIELLSILERSIQNRYLSL